MQTPMPGNGNTGVPQAERRRKGAALRILKSATELFYQRGIRAVGVDEIVLRAGATKPSLYHSFASKDGLVAACLQELADEARTELDARIAAAGDAPLDQLRMLVGYCAERMAAPGFRGSPMTNAAVEFPDAEHPARAVIVTSKMELYERVRTLTGRLPVADAECLADGIILLIEGAFSSHHVFGLEGPAKILVQAVDRQLDAYLRR